MITATRFLAFAAILFHGAIFGFFYAWVCSTMWGLDSAPPETAIAAMQAMNGSVRNATFAPAFFGTPVISLVTAILCFATQSRTAGYWFLAACVTYFSGGLLLTMAVNVPMNEALAIIEIPADPQATGKIWSDYSAPWQFWNQTRTVLSAIALIFATMGLYMLAQRTPSLPDRP
jgi:uncharacterized membrane protein